MTGALGSVARFFDKDREPLRRKVYGVVVFALGLAVTAGVVTGDEAASIAGVLGTLLVIPATEIARQQVTPTLPAKHRAAP